MPDEPRPPVAIRSLRPYATEEDFLAAERDTLTRSAVTLIGAPSRPRGVIIRFELALRDGTPLVRGEGRVLGHQPADEKGPSSLTLRFTRLDVKSKALVDRAAALREGREVEAESLTSDTEPPPGESTSRATPVPDAPQSSSEPPPASSSGEIALLSSSTTLPVLDVEEIGARIAASVHAPESAPEEPHAATSVARGEVDVSVAVDTSAAKSPVPSDAERDTLLGRLRDRAKTLSPSQVATILAVPRTSS